ncbi:MAG: hypothetical protein IJN63_09040 [Clostridia bacterium]|nr:hypothetical protein [Clostridia bacterium]
MKKRVLALILASLIAASACGCTGTPPSVTEPPSTDPTDAPASTDAPETEPPEETLKAFNADISGSAYKTYSRETTATVRENAVNTVKKELFGDNLSNRGNGYGVYIPETDSFNTKLVEAIKRSGVTTLRYPGGTQGDYLIWHEMIGSDRKMQIDPFSASYPTNAQKNGELFYPAFGWEEFMELCSLLGVEAVVQLNAGNGTAEDAAALIKWCEDNGYPVSSYCIGNEVNMNLENVEGMKVSKTPEQYIEFANKVYEGIGSLADDITLGVLALPEGHGLNHWGAAWDRKIITALGDKIDFIDCHYGYAVQDSSSSSYTDEEIFRAYMAAPTFIKSLIEKTKEEIKTYAPEHADEISIQITEYGPIGSFNNGTVGAVFLASVIQVMANEPMISSANHLPLLNHYAAANTVGYKNTNGTEYFWDNLTTYIFEWYTEQIGRQVLKTELETFTFSSTKVGLTPGVMDAEMGNTAVYYDPEAGEGSVFVINHSYERNMVTNVLLPFDSITVTGFWELYSDDPTAANSAQSPMLVTPRSYSIKKGRTYSGEMKITSKPISVVKIDFKVVK